MQTSDFGKFTCRNHLKGSLVGILCSSFNLSSPPLIYFGFRIILKYYLFFFKTPNLLVVFPILLFVGGFDNLCNYIWICALDKKEEKRQKDFF